MEQIKFEELITKDRYLCVVKDNEIVNMKYTDIFDAAKYNELHAITYVSSPTFFSKTVAGFNKVEIILGINDSDLLNNFTHSLDKLLNIKDRVDFWNSLNDKVKESIAQDNILIRFSSNFPIHSKLYLLKNTSTDNTRVVLGSANLTDAAFSNTKQFEDIIIIDNDLSLFNIYYEQRFKILFNECVDYIPDRVKKDFDKGISIILLDKETAAEILSNDLEKNRLKIFSLTDEQMKQIKARPQKNVEQQVFKKEEIERNTNILNAVLKKKNNAYTVKPFIEIKRQQVVLQTLISKSSKKITEDIRPFYNYRDEDDLIYVIDKNTVNQDVYKQFSSPIDLAEIRDGLIMIEDFLEAYESFTISPDKNYQSKVMEIILFAFMSPFIWKLREEFVIKTASESNRSAFPIFLVITGRAASGKTTALEFIGMLLGNDAPYYIPYSSISNAKSVKKDILEGYLGSEYLSPILVDEINSTFFTGKIGENIIKQASNNISGKHPVFIGTTNTREFNTSSQVLRRIYYIQVDSEFDTKNFGAKSKNYINELKARVSTNLFRDFCYRVCLKIKNNEEIYKLDDFLLIARQIFLDYYNETGLKKPEWFPNKPFFDYEQRGKTLWKTLYQTKKLYFKERNDGTIYVESMLFNNNKKEKDNCLNYLGVGCIKEDNQILLLNAENFYNFIGEEKEKTLLSRIKEIVKRANH